MPREGGERRRGKGGKYKKKKGRKEEVKPEDLDYLVKNTRYEAEEIKEWFRYRQLRKHSH